MNETQKESLENTTETVSVWVKKQLRMNNNQTQFYVSNVFVEKLFDEMQ